MLPGRFSSSQPFRGNIHQKNKVNKIQSYRTVIKSKTTLAKTRLKSGKAFYLFQTGKTQLLSQLLDRAQAQLPNVAILFPLEEHNPPQILHTLSSKECFSQAMLTVPNQRFSLH